MDAGSSRDKAAGGGKTQEKPFFVQDDSKAVFSDEASVICAGPTLHDVLCPFRTAAGVFAATVR